MIRVLFAARQKGAARALLLAPVCAALVGTTAPAMAKTTYVTFDVPGAIYTDAFYLNGDLQIAGDWEDVLETYHGYVRAADGTISPFDPPQFRRYRSRRHRR